MKENKNKTNKIIIRGLKIAVIIIALILTSKTVYGVDDPLAVINNLSTFIFSIIRAIGMILLGWGIVQIGLALKSHDPSQRANGFMTLARRSNNYICKRNFGTYNRKLK